MGGKNQAGVSGDGFRFEHDVGAILSIMMLAESGLDLFPGEVITSVQPQCTDQIERKIDDYILHIQGKLTPAGRKVYVQCKSTISLTASGPFADAIFGAYCDYLTHKPEYEEYVLVTGPMSQKDYRSVDNAFINFHRRRPEQFWDELDNAALDNTKRVFEVCRGAIKNKLEGGVVDEGELLNCLKHFYILRPDLRERGSLDGSIASALLGELGYERIDDAVRKIREEIENNSVGAARFCKEDVEGWLLPYRKKSAGEANLEGEIGEASIVGVCDINNWSSPFLKIWSEKLDSCLFETSVTSEESRSAAIELGARAHAVEKQPITVQSEWADAIWGKIRKFADADIKVWENSRDGLSCLVEIGTSYFIKRIERDCDKIKGWLKDVGGTFVVGYLLRGFAQALNHKPQWLTVYSAVLLIAKAEYELNVYRDAHSFIEFFLSEDNLSSNMSVDLREGTIKEILRGEPEIGWRIILNLIPAVRVARMHYSAPSAYDNHVSESRIDHADITRLQQKYIEFACEAALHSSDRMLELIKMANVASKSLFDETVKATKKIISKISVREKHCLWESLMNAWESVITSPFATDEIDERQLALIECASIIQPEDNKIICERFFVIDEVYLRASISGVLAAKLDAMIKAEGTDAIIQLASRAKCPGTIGKVLYEKVGNCLLRELVLPGLASGSSGVDEFVRVYLVCCFSQKQIEAGLDEAFDYLDSTLNLGAVDDEKRGAVYSRLYFARKIREKALERIGNRNLNYWSGVKIGLYPDKDLRDISTIVDGLLLVGRAFDAVKECRYAETLGNEVDSSLLFRSVVQYSMNLPGNDTCHENRYYMYWAIRKLNMDDSLPVEELSEAELRLLPYYYACHDFESQRPKATYKRMGQDAVFFVKLMREGFPMVRTWDVCPGSDSNGFEEGVFMRWLNKVYEMIGKDVNLKCRVDSAIAEVMNYLPDDEDRPFVYPKIWAFLESKEGESLLEKWKMVLRRGGSILEIIHSQDRKRNLRLERYKRYSALALKNGFSKMARVFEETAA